MTWLDSARKALSNAVRADGWFNLLSGVGSSTSRAQMSFEVNATEYLGLADMENLYNFDGVAARVVDSVPEHALRQGFTVSTGEASVETALLESLTALDAVGKVRLAWTWGRCFGGGALYIGADDGRGPEEPLDESSVRAMRWLVDVDRRDIYPLTWERDPASGRFGQPETYVLNRIGGAVTDTVTVHHSRVIRFEGASPTRRRRLTLQWWGESVLQRCYQELMQARGAFAAAGDLVQQASQGVLKLKGLMDMMASDTDDLVKRRLHLMDLSRSVARSMLLDADGEDFSRVEASSLSGVAEIMDRAVNLLSAVSKIPVTVLMGQAPAGLNATGDSDIRNWYDGLQAEREQVLRPVCTRIVRLILRSREGPTGGQEPEGWRIVLPSLWQATPVEDADMRSKQATIDTQYISAGVLTPEEVAVSRFRKEGWSSDTSIDLEARAALIEADKSDPGAGALVPDGQHDDVAAVIARVAGREIPRDAGVAILVDSLGLEAGAAERVMGEAGRSFWTKPDPAAVAELDSLRAAHSQLEASHRGTKQMLARVLERNRAGELVVGSPIAAKPTEVDEGDVLEEGDVVAVAVEGDDLPTADAAPHAGLVQKKIQVHGPSGTYERTTWVKPSEAPAKPTASAKPAAPAAKPATTAAKPAAPPAATPAPAAPATPAVRPKPPGSQFTPKEQEKFKELGLKKLPPASVPTSAVKVNMTGDVNAHAVLTWRDAKGKVQSEYTAEFHKQNAVKKFARVQKLRPKLEAIEGDLRKQALAGSDAHAIGLVIAHTGLRVGGEESAADGHFGVSTIQAKHVTKNSDGTVDLKYIGKAGHENVAHIEDKQVAKLLQEHVKGKKPDDRVFDAKADAVRKAMPTGVHPKDFRTVMAARTAETALTEHVPPPPLTGDEKKDMKLVLQAMKAASDKTAKALNNTPAVARKAYIPPTTWTTWAKKVGVPEAWTER